MDRDTEILLPTGKEPAASAELYSSEFPTRGSTSPTGNEKARGQRSEDYIDILVRARNWLARGE
jgi:hypothetical protein